MNPVIKFENVSKLYRLGLTRSSLPSLVSQWLKSTLSPSAKKSDDDNRLWALWDVSFELEKGKSLALVGSNGAGKTTILKLLASITSPTSGRIQANGKLSALIELGAGFHPDLTGRENIYLNGTILGLNRQAIDSHFDEIVDFSEIDRFIDTPVKRYSSGMIVRLGFAVASCIEPEILLVDEVLAVGDVAFQQKCLKRINSLIEHGTSIIFVSHNFYLVRAVCDRALYLQKGRLKRWGPVNEVIEQYEHDLHQERAQKNPLTHDPVVQSASSADDIKISRVEFKDAINAEAPVFLSDQPFEIHVHYDSHRVLGAVQMSVFIIRSDGLTCCMMRTKVDQFNLFVEQGRGCVSVRLAPLQLVGGTYYAEAWFLNESDSLGITSKGTRSDWFTVKGKSLSYEASAGVFEPKVHWSHSRDGEGKS